jgi:hypothetical protein
MGYQLAGYSLLGIPVSGAYLRIRNNTLLKTEANIIADIYQSKAIYQSGGPVLQSLDFIFQDDQNASITNLFSANFNCAPGAPPVGLPAPTSVIDIVIAQGYLALPNHPNAAALLSGATAE